MYPAFLRLKDRKVVLVGGGRVAAAKLQPLLHEGARVTVVAPEIRPELEVDGVELQRRLFDERDLDGAWYVVAAAPREVNRQVLDAAERHRIFVNAVDDPANATAYAGGVVRRSSVTVAISTDGRAPALAGLLREALDAWLPVDLDAWLATADELRREWKRDGVPMEERRPALLEALNQLYESRASNSQASNSRSQTGVSLVGAGPGDPELWTVRARQRVETADLVLYDALVDAVAVRAITRGQCFCVGKRAGRASVKQDTINRLMIRAARQGKRVVRLKGGDPFVFGRGAEEALALTAAGIPFEIVPGVTAAVAAPELAGIPVTHRGVASGFLVIAGQTGEPLDAMLDPVRPNSLTLVVMMGVAGRDEIAAQLLAHHWSAETPAAIVCGVSTCDEWTWTGRLAAIASAEPPAGIAGVLVVGEVVRIREALAQAQAEPPALARAASLAEACLAGGCGGGELQAKAEGDRVKYGRS
ncbi:MAG TPA: uroporphyrinogen-III C-methyltransferase [Vicinamibacterales bacterium]|jgi:uroporphyrin-III C-methyltransferase / precorrin-2 dehydrogenase / sirohydrochlorin ferrochelatase|nr:uroporphyrinogen-III C-methyltransferase [Vicinamibacterales bacterium]